MCHFDNLVKLVSLDNDCMFHFIFDVIYGKIRKRIGFVLNNLTIKHCDRTKVKIITVKNSKKLFKTF